MNYIKEGIIIGIKELYKVKHDIQQLFAEG